MAHYKDMEEKVKIDDKAQGYKFNPLVPGGNKKVTDT